MPRKLSLESLRSALGRLSLQEKQKIWVWLSEEILLEQEVVESSRNLDGAMGKPRDYEGKIYQQEKRRCSRVGCRCMVGEVAEVGHGPYWYAYWKEGGRLRSQYVGKQAPWME